ncbi:hypothetical protein [Parafrankia sp. FMc2]|uniref:hypothetical protein n=1 Tax=Parafrankia sp. FMc2 TaxID=3233196 RepID=UPI0034D51E41
MCGTDPSSWQASVTKEQTNSTGKNLGFFLDGTSISGTGSGGYYKYFDAEIDASTCVPRVGWPCSSSYSLTVSYTVTLDRFGNPQVYQSAASAPLGMTLFSTP